jgi:hypothetical protein
VERKRRNTRKREKDGIRGGDKEMEIKRWNKIRRERERIREGEKTKE